VSSWIAERVSARGSRRSILQGVLKPRSVHENPPEWEAFREISMQCVASISSSRADSPPIAFIAGNYTINKAVEHPTALFRRDLMLLVKDRIRSAERSCSDSRLNSSRQRLRNVRLGNLREKRLSKMASVSLFSCISSHTRALFAVPCIRSNHTLQEQCGPLRRMKSRLGKPLYTKRCS